jgi:hypothetical protein
MSSGEIANIVGIVGMLLTYFGIAIDPALLNAAVQGIAAVITIGALCWSWYQHRQSSAQSA